MGGSLRLGLCSTVRFRGPPEALEHDIPLVTLGRPKEWETDGSGSPVTRSPRRSAVAAGLVAALLGTLLAAAPDPAGADVTFVVNRAADDSDLNLANDLCDTSAQNGLQCTLRAAIQEANDTAGADTINFNIGTDGGLKGITPASPLPAITEAVTINGYSQLGSVQNTLATGNDAILRIRLSGVDAGAAASGLRILADEVVVKGLAINAFGADGIRIDGSNNSIEGNFIGTSAAGTADLGNLGAGISILDGSVGNTIGRTNVRARNVISGNDESGILIQAAASDGNAIRNNYIGTNAAGTAALGNGLHGVHLSEATDTTIGGTTPAARNVISGNGADGILVGGAPDTSVLGNFLGTDASGTTDLGNELSGVTVATTGVRIGGLLGGRNVISGNRQGILIAQPGSTGNVVAGNFIGTDVTGTIDLGNEQDGVLINTASGNTVGGSSPVSRNLISGNGGSGVKIDGASATGNVVVRNTIGTDENGSVAIGNAGSGVAIIQGSNNTVGDQNLISGNGDHGVLIQGANATGNVVRANDIGTDRLRTADLGNGGDGVRIDAGAHGNTVGGDGAVRNHISGNTGRGVAIVGGSTENVVAGNFIGTDATGSAAIGNGVGVEINASDDNTVGRQNVISGNLGDGILVDGSTGTSVVGNLIGTTPNRDAPLPNGGHGVAIRQAIGTRVGGFDGLDMNEILGNGGDGINIFGAQARFNLVAGNLIGINDFGEDLGNAGSGVVIAGAPDNQIGGTEFVARNYISGNGLDGIELLGIDATANDVLGNLIGTDLTGDAALPNDGNGILIDNASDNVVGGSTDGARNVISGNGGVGVQVSGFSAANNTVRRNFIGTNDTGQTAVGNTAGGVLVLEASDNLIGGQASSSGNFIAGNGGPGVEISGDNATNNRIQGNQIGFGIFDADVPNEAGVVITSPANQVGGTGPGVGNTISGNDLDGVLIDGSAADANVLQGNFIGTDSSGSEARGNGSYGVIIVGAADSVIGGTSAAARNVISDNPQDGIALIDAPGTIIRGNRIGTQANGSGDLGNGANGVAVLGTSDGVIIGGTVSGAANTIARNDEAGVRIQTPAAGTRVEGNSIVGNDDQGVFVSGDGSRITANAIVSNGLDGVLVTAQGQGNAIRNNQILGNAELGINLVGGTENPAGVTSNDTDDPDVGANRLQNFPVLSSAVRNPMTTATLVTGSLNSTPSREFLIQLFLVAADGSGHGEAVVFLAQTKVSTNAGGDVGFAVTIGGLVPGQQVTATATNISTSDTSEFAQNRTVTPA